MGSKIKIVLLLLLITTHSFLMNGFFHASRFLNVATYVTPIVAQADSTLFRKSLYVESLREKNARLSIMHDLMPSFLPHIDLETFALIQWIICLFLTTAALFYFGRTLIGSDIAGYGVALLFCSKLNDWAFGSPSIYINYFHHGGQWAVMLNIFSLALIFKKRYPLALLLMGIAWNFHPMSVVFLFLLLVPYWIVHRGEWGFKKLTLCAVAFVLPALPLLLKSLNYLAMHWEYGSAWMTGVKWTAWYTVFPSTWPLSYFFRAGLFFWLFVMGLSAFPAGEKKRDSILFVVTIGALCMVGTVFAEVYPIPFVMKLSLWRTSWIYIILSLPLIVHLLIAMWDHTLLKRFAVVATLMVITGYVHYVPSYYLLLFNTSFLLFLLEPQCRQRWKWVYEKLPRLFFIILLILIAYQGLFDWGVTGTLAGMVFIALLLLLLQAGARSLPRMKPSRLCIGSALLFIVLFDACILLYRGGPDIYYHGHLRGKRDPWADVQLFAKEHTHKDDLFIVPPYSNDFGLYSERATLGDWAEGANILYMDNAFAEEWLVRMNDLGWKTFLGSRSGYNGLSTEQVLVTAQKYGAAYIVTEKPKHFELPAVYGNDAFMLYQVPGSEE